MKVLIACEESQVVTKEFRVLGHEAYSCDIEPCSGGHPEWHIQGSVLEILNDGWDMMIGFPPCTYLTYAGTRHWNNPGRLENRLKALDFFAALWLAPIKKICGDSFSKPTCLFLKNLPSLIHTETNTLFEKATHVDKGEFVEFITKKGTIKRESKWYRELSGDSRQRSKTFQGIAKAMASQWG